MNGNVQTNGDLAVNGGDITTNSALASLFNTNATTINFGGAATTLTIGAATGTTYINNNLTLNNNSDLTTTGNVTFTPNDTKDIVFNTDTNSILQITGLPTATGDLMCINSSTSQVIKCANDAISLQGAYVGGNTITTSNARDISFTLTDTVNDANFVVNTATGSTGGSRFIRTDGAGTADPTQLVLIDNADANRILPTGLRITASGGAGGGVTTAVDLSDPAIVNAIALGANNITGTNFSVDGNNGNITSSGNIAVNGGNVTTTNTGTATLFNTNATGISIGGDATTYTIGATTAQGTLHGSTISFPDATSLTASNALASFDSLSVGGGYGNDGVSITNAGDISTDGNLTADGSGLSLIHI